MIENREYREIAEKMGTPVMVYDEDAIVERMREYTDNFRSYLFKTKVLYASKAFICGAMARLAEQEGLCFDVVSGGEVNLLKANRITPEKIYFHGNNKTRIELIEFLKYGKGTIIADNMDEIRLLIEVAEDIEEDAAVIIRINPGIDAHTHEYIKTATKDSKFGISSDDKEGILEMVKAVRECEFLKFKGFHAHIGSQIFDKNAFLDEIHVMCEFLETMKKEYGVSAETLDLGGGFAIRFTDSDAPIPIPMLCQEMIATLEAEMEQRNLDIKEVLIEPGRSIAGEAGVTIYSAGALKKTATKEFLFIDGGMSDNIRPALYQAEYECENLSRPDEEPVREYEVAGKCCESGDILIHGAKLPKTERGDFIKVNATGAYGYAMASNYNRMGRPPVVFVREGIAKCVLRRESYIDMRSLETETTL